MPWMWSGMTTNVSSCAFGKCRGMASQRPCAISPSGLRWTVPRSEEHTSELQSQSNPVCRLLLEKKKEEISHPLASENHLPATCLLGCCQSVPLHPPPLDISKPSFGRTIQEVNCANSVHAAKHDC